MKNPLKYFGLFLLTLVFACQELDSDPNYSPQTENLREVKRWFESTYSPVDLAFGYRKLQWQRAVPITKNSLTGFEIPLDGPGQIVSTNANMEEPVRTYQSVIIFKKAQGAFEASALEFLPKPEHAELLTSVLHRSRSLFYNLKFFSGTVNFRNLETRSLTASYILSAGVPLKESSNAREATNSRYDCYEETTHYWTSVCGGGSCSYHHDYSSTTTYCTYTPDQYTYDQSVEPADTSGGGGGGGGGGDWSDGGNDSDGIDCASFNFTETTDTWQEAAVRNIGFKVKVIDSNTGNTTTSEFKITRTLYFGLPISTYDNQEISAGQAAEMAASAVQYASDLTHALYIENPNTPISTAESWFLSFLKQKMLTDGGRVDFYGTGSPNVTANDASYALLGNGDCD